MLCRKFSMAVSFVLQHTSLASLVTCYGARVLFVQYRFVSTVTVFALWNIISLRRRACRYFKRK